MARKPNYDFERKERERIKKQKNEERAQAKLKAAQEDNPLSVETDETPKDED